MEKFKEGDINDMSIIVESIKYHLIPYISHIDSSQKMYDVLVMEPDYLPDLEVFYFQLCLYPMKYLHPRSMYTLPRGGVQSEGYPLYGVWGGYTPSWGVWG
jgi:hypothetical protein